jgi:hypothetical protein
MDLSLSDVEGWVWIAVAFAGGLLPVLPWFVLSPLMMRVIGHRTELALEPLIKIAMHMPVGRNVHQNE